MHLNTFSAALGPCQDNECAGPSEAAGCEFSRTLAKQGREYRSTLGRWLGNDPGVSPSRGLVQSGAILTTPLLLAL